MLLAEVGYARDRSPTCSAYQLFDRCSAISRNVQPPRGRSNSSGRRRSRGPTCYTTFLASRDSVRRNRAAFDAMVRATRRTLAWVAGHSAEELADAVAPYYPQVPREILASSYQRYRNAGLWSRTPEVQRQGFTRLADSLKSGGYISKSHNYEDCVEQSLS